MENNDSRKAFGATVEDLTEVLAAVRTAISALGPLPVVIEQAAEDATVAQLAAAHTAVIDAARV